MSSASHSPSSSSLSLSSSPSPSSSSLSLSTTSSPTYTLLPSSAFANEAILKQLTAKVEKGAGDLFLLCLGAEKEWIKEAIAEMGEAVLGDQTAFVVDGRWTKLSADVHGNKAPYYALDPSACYSPKPDSSIEIELEFEESESKLAHPTLLNLFAEARLRSILHLSSPSSSAVYLLERPVVAFPPLTPVHGTPYGTPSPQDWHDLWAAWDAITLGMIPSSMLHQKPIDLRHKCLFYIGHIPTFLDMLLSKTLNEPHTEPAYFTKIFERGIDPHVDDPDHCHNHSEVPEKDEDWPSLATILEYRDRVRARLLRLFDDINTGKRQINRRIARTIVLTLEHEAFHVETLLYMLIQRAGTGTIPPPTVTPPWSALARQWSRTEPPSTPTVTLGPTTITLGHEDSELDDLEPAFIDKIDGHEFGWDNESPARQFPVGKFKIDWRPVTNKEFYAFWKGAKSSGVHMPASWIAEAGSIKVRTLYGPVDFETAEHWPVLTSYDNLLAYAKHKGGRIPTEVELRWFLDTFEVGHQGGANVGFRNWHSTPATTGTAQDGGRGSNGGVWEWTSTLFDGHDGLAPTSLFPGYSTDFFDTKHHIALGASYATLPRQASRRTIRNFYQHNYPYPWVGARVAYDI